MNKFYLKSLLLCLLFLLGIAQAFSHNIAVANADGVTIYYKMLKRLNDFDTYLSVTYCGNNYNSYSDEYYGDVVIPETVTTSDGSICYVISIDSEAFRGCSGLTSVTIPKSVTYIGDRAFYGCSNLEQITVDDGNPSYDSRENCDAIICTENNTLIVGCKNTRIPNSVTSIGELAFAYNSGLTSITIPNSVTEIGSSAFQGCI